MQKGELDLGQNEVIQFYLDDLLLEVEHGEIQTREGVGEVFITTECTLPRRIHWRTGEKSLELSYAVIAMHGMSSDPANFGAPCVIVQLTCEEEDESTKWILKPVDSTQRIAHTVQLLYDSISECSELQPPLEAEADADCFCAQGADEEEEKFEDAEI